MASVDSVQERKEAHKHEETPRKSPSQDPTLDYVGVRFLENKGEEAPPPRKELGFTNLYAEDPIQIIIWAVFICFFRPVRVLE